MDQSKRTGTIEIRIMQPDQWQLYKAVRCAALADTPAAFSGTLENALQRSDEEWALNQR